MGGFRELVKPTRRERRCPTRTGPARRGKNLPRVRFCARARVFSKQNPPSIETTVEVFGWEKKVEACVYMRAPSELRALCGNGVVCRADNSAATLPWRCCATRRRRHAYPAPPPFFRTAWRTPVVLGTSSSRGSPRRSSPQPPLPPSSLAPPARKRGVKKIAYYRARVLFQLHSPPQLY